MPLLGIFAAFLVFFSTASLVDVSRTVKQTYLILSPKAFWPGKTLTIKVTILKSSSPVTVTASIVSGYRHEQSKLIADNSGVFSVGKTADLDLQVPSGLSTGGYRLVVNGTGGLNFHNESYITLRSKGMSIYVQMDKGVYKPGQKVQMRVFALMPNLKSYTGKMTVDILDPNESKMAHWPKIQGPNGIIKKEFPLSSQPVMGKWQIMVTAENGEKFSKSFEVKEYVLPKFDVSIVLPPYVTKQDKQILIKVASKYTYGKGVKGSVDVRGYFLIGHKEHDCFTRNPEIDGEVSIQLTMEKVITCFKKDVYSAKSQSDIDYYMFRRSYSPFIINATVTEDLTGKNFSEKAQVKFSYSNVKLEFPSFNPSSYKPGLEFVTLLKITQPNGDPLLDPELLKTMKVTIKTTYELNVAPYTRRQAVDAYSPSSEGVIVIKRTTPGQNTSSIRIEAEYKIDDNCDECKETTSFTAYKSVSPSDSYIQLMTTTPSVKAGEMIDFKVVSSFDVLSYIYVILARGKIREMKSSDITNNAKEFTFSIVSTHIMAPSAQVIVYTIRTDGEVVVDSLSITVENPFENEVSVKFSRDKSGPGDRIGLVAKASPGSRVAFLVVDKSVLLMKKDNDLSRDQVLQDLQAYSTGSSWYPWWTWSWFAGGRSRRMIMPFPTSGRDAMSIFENAGLIVFSDCLVFKSNPYDSGLYPMYHLMRMETAASGDSRSAPAPPAAGKPLAEVTRVRSLFPETWIWMDYNVSSTGEAEISTSVPDTITSWVASAFAISPQAGFGIGSLKPKLQVFQPFFVSLDLPYSVVRGEEVAIKALVFNYQEQPQEVTITFKASTDFEAINEVDSSGGKYEREAVDIKKVLSIPAGVGRAVAFPIKPKTLGHVPIIVQAQSTVAADAVKRTILVEAEGVPNSYSYSVLIDLNTTSSFTKTLELALPKSTVKGSAHAKVTVIGDILGSSFSNLDNLLRMPYGCGEQNMVNFAPNIYVLKYLTAVNKVTEAIRNKAENYMVTGYQREQTYRHKDGAYSAFGERDKEGSMWLTAFVVKSFAQARKYIYVDPDSLKLSLNFIARKQNKDGSFPTLGKVHGSYLKGGNDGKVSLSAYVVIALAEADSTDKAVMLAKQEGIRYLESTLDSTISKNDVYTLSLTAYALRLVNSAYSAKAWQALFSLAIKKDGMIHWSNAKQDSDQSTEYRPYYRPRSADVEITAYALLTLCLNKDFKNGLPVVRWLTVQRNSFGGYASTQDTVLGIQALSEFASLVYSSSKKFEVNLKQSADKGFSKTFNVDASNAMVLQQALISKVEGNLEILAQGHGIGMLQVGVDYNVEKIGDKSDFDFVIEILNEENYEIETKSCAKWQGDGDESDMAVMELGIASGFTPNQDAIDKLMNGKDLAVKRVETESKKLVVYFDKISKKDKTCIIMKYDRTHPVGKGQPVPAVVYDYYNPEHRAEALYSSDKLGRSSVCRFCAICENCEYKVESTSSMSSFSSKLSANLTITLTICLLSLLSLSTMRIIT